MPLKAMSESQTKGKFSNTDPTLLKIFHSSQIIFCINFHFKNNCIKISLILITEFLGAPHILCPHALQGGFSSLPIVLSLEQGEKEVGLPASTVLAP